MRQLQRKTYGLLGIGAAVIIGGIVTAVTIIGSIEPSAGDPAPINYYVSPNGSDEYPGTDKARPLATIERAVEQADAGDTIHLADGDYRQNITTIRPGLPTAPITITGSRKATIYGNDGHVIEIHHSYIVLDGFHVNGKIGSGNDKKDYRDKLIYVIGTRPKKGIEGLKINNLLIENGGGECVRLRYFAAHNEISNTTIRNCGIYDFRFNDGGKNGEAIYIGTAPEQRSDGKNPTADPDGSNTNWVHDNTIESYGNECVDIKESAYQNLVEHNTCSHQQDPKSGGFDARGNDNTFRYNTIRDNRGAGLRIGGDSPTDGLRNSIYGNLITNNEAGAVRFLRQPQGKICGNTLHDNGEVDEASAKVDVAVNCN